MAEHACSTAVSDADGASIVWRRLALTCTAVTGCIALSESQQDRIEALDAEYAAQIDERQQRRSELREELNAAQQAGQVSEAKRIRRQLREFRRSPTRPAHLRAIREVLTAPQQVTFDQNRKAFRERAQEQRERARLQRPPRPVPMEEPAEEGASEEGAGEASP